MTEELKYLKSLAKYFKRVPQKDINQCMDRIVYKKNCGCFGAHIAKKHKDFITTTICGETIKVYDYVHGINIFKDRISRKTERLFVKHGAVSGGTYEGGIFSAAPWLAHPYKVIKKVIGELENERSN